jgi:FkbM family methyltransferase
LHLEGTPHAWTFARFADACRDLDVKPRHVLHIGGHLGQEVEHYRAAGVERITYMEPTPDSAAHLRTLGPDVTVVEAAAGADWGTIGLKVCGGDGAWNTLRAEVGQGAGVHGVEAAVLVDVIPVRELQAQGLRAQEPADVLVVDTQGTEVEVLGSADLASPWLQLVIVETQASGHPEAAHVAEVSAHMAAHGWTPVLAWNHEYGDRPHATFADVFYLPARERPR